MVISLIGYRGSGKSTIGQLLAEILGWTYADSDAEIEAAVGMSIRDIFQREGEPKFRQYESELVRSLARRHKLVLALGGGAVLREENRRTVQAAGPVIYLTASVDTLFRRICEDPSSHSQRPPLSSGGREEVEQILAQRQPIYQSCADYEISTEDRPPRTVVQQIVEKLDLRPLGSEH